MSDDRWWNDLDAVVAAGVPPGSRVLDVGCGDGGLVARLVDRGFDAFGVDPEAPRGPRLSRQRVEQAASLGSFDAVTAVMSLHHADLGPALDAIAALLRPGGRLFVSELAWESYDARSAAWVSARDTTGADSSVERWRAEHSDLHTSATIRSALDAVLTVELDVGRPYLARMLRQRHLETEERAAIDANALPAVGRRLVAVRPAA